VNDFHQFLNIFWEEEVNPTREQTRQAMGINGTQNLYSISHALTHLEKNYYIQIIINDKGNEVILRGENPFPEHYSYLRYCLEIPLIEL